MILIQSGKSYMALYQAILEYKKNPNVMIYCKPGSMFDELLKYIPAENLTSVVKEPDMDYYWWEGEA